MAVELGTGYVTIIPSAKGIKGKLEQELGGPELDAAAEKAGDTAGESFSGGFGNKAKAGALLAGAAFAAVLATGVSDALDQGAISDKLAAKLDLDPAESARAGAVAGDLYTQAYGSSFEDVTDQLGNTLRTFGTDITDAEAFGLTAGSIDLVTAFDVDAERLAATTGLVLRNGLADSATEAQDVVTAALQGINAPAGDVLDTLYEFSEPLASLGLTGGAAIGVLSAAADAGVFDLTKAGDAVKEFSIRAIDGSTATGEAYALLGLDADEFSARIAEGGPAAQQAFGEVLTALDGISDPLAKEAAGVALFGTTYEDLGPAAISSLNPLNATIEDVAGSTSALGDVLNDNLKVQLESIKRQGFQALATVLTAVVIPAISGTISAVSAIAGFLGRNRAVAIGLAAGLTVLAIAIGGPLVLAAGAATLSFIGLAAAQVAALLPVIAVAAAIGLLVAGIIWAYENVEIFRVAVDAVAGFLTGTVWPAIQLIAEAVGVGLVAAFGFIVDAFGVFLGVGATVVNLIGRVLVGAVKGAIAIVNGFLGVVKAAPGIVKTGIDKVVGFFQYVGGVAADVFNGIMGGIDRFVGTITALPSRIRSAAAGMFDSIKDGARTAFNAIARFWNSTVGSIGFTVPGWIPGAGGKSFSVPKVPVLHEGGVIPGRPGQEVIILAEAGELVTSRADVAAGRNQRAPVNVTAYVNDGRQFLDLLETQAVFAQ